MERPAFLQMLDAIYSFHYPSISRAVVRKLAGHAFEHHCGDHDDIAGAPIAFSVRLVPVGTLLYGEKGYVTGTRVRASRYGIC